jgi:hypothetical protein
VGFKRPGRKHKLEASVELLGAPSEYGKVFGRTQTINDEMAIFCARPAELAWINVRIMHKVFHEVVQAFMTGDPESDDYRLAYKLRVTMAGSFKNEASRRDEITRLFALCFSHCLLKNKQLSMALTRTRRLPKGM